MSGCAVVEMRNSADEIGYLCSRTASTQCSDKAHSLPKPLANIFRENDLRPLAVAWCGKRSAETQGSPTSANSLPTPAPRTSPEKSKDASTVSGTQPAHPDSASQPAPAEPTAKAAEPNDTEASIGAWTDEKPRIRRDGAKITAVTPNSAADQAGIQAGDYILAVGGTYIFTPEELVVAIHRYKPGDHVSIRYRHNTTINDTDVIMAKGK